MFEVVPEPEFTAWFEALPAPYAEEVAAAIDLTARTSALVPERLSRLVLWFDGTNDDDNASVDLAGRMLELREPPAHHLRDYLSWHHEVVLCLESAAFQERLARLDAPRSEQALGLVELLKRRLHAARLATTLNPWSQGLTSHQSGLLREWTGVRQAFTDLLQTMGLAVNDVLGSGSGLRELTLGNMQPRLRILFGLDFPGKRLLAIVGEALDRRYYGDSVGRAERRWQLYLESQARSLEQRAT
jgi:hypothetical protein